MINLLKPKMVDYINQEKNHFLPHFDGSPIILKYEIISDALFDIQDLKPTIKQAVGTGSATYENSNNKSLHFIDYEDFIKQMPDRHTRCIKTCDFIVYEDEDKSIFILNELSQSSNPDNKRSKAKEQLRNTLSCLYGVPELKAIIASFSQKQCIFSNRNSVTTSPNNIAVPFEYINDLLQEPIVLKYQPITKLGFKLIETNTIKIN